MYLGVNKNLFTSDRQIINIVIHQKFNGKCKKKGPLWLKATPILFTRFKTVLPAKYSRLCS